MLFVERLRAAGNRGEAAPVPVRTLAIVGLVGGSSSVFAAAFPAYPEAPVGLLWVTGPIVLASSVALWRAGDRVPSWLLQVLVAGGTLGISAVIARSATGLGMVVTANAYLWLAVYAAFFFSRRAARAHMTLIAIAFGAALLVNDVSIPVDAWLFVTASLLLAEETVGRQTMRLRREAHTDSLTGLLNRKGLAPAAAQAFSLADRAGIPLTVALIDLDDFKQVNDRDGHQAGDRVLVQMARIWRTELEATDVFARLGGDEFLVILVGLSGEQCDRLFERLRFLSPAPWSAGLVRRDRGEDLSGCLAKADLALYNAKRAKPSAMELHAARSGGPVLAG